tara:strand:+ start:934 stop:2250 length:1317 start_codon:yes stop_codon:yes gene_type:complete
MGYNNLIYKMVLENELIKKLILFFVILSLFGCSAAAEISSKVSEKESSSTSTTSTISKESKLYSDPITLQHLGFENTLPDIMLQNYLVLKEFKEAKSKLEKKGYDVYDGYVEASEKSESDKISIDLSGGRALVSTKDDMMFIIYRSTSGDRTDFTKNVLTDLDGALISPEWYDGENSDSVLIHRGFDTEYSRFRNKILNIAARTESKKFIISGHSLGSALSTLTALDLASNYKYDVSVVTFGSPRVGNKDFREVMEKYVPDNYRIYFPDDPIVSIPGLLIEYEHAGIALGISSEGTQNNKISTDNFGIAAYKSIFNENFKIHMIGNYIKSINTILQSCYQDEQYCFNLRKGMEVAMIERETMNQYRSIFKAKPEEFKDALVIKSKEAAAKKQKELEKKTEESISNLENFIKDNQEKIETEWFKSYKTMAESKAKSLIE